MQYKQYRIGKYYWSNVELRDLAKALAAISLAFAIALGGLSGSFFAFLLVSAFTVGIGFLLHELGHKVVAQQYGCKAEFRSFDGMLIIALILSFLGFLFAAPGAVMIATPVSREQNGKISAAGPLVNIALALLFFLGELFIGTAVPFRFGFTVNALLAVFNLLPVGNFDGSKVLAWHKGVYGIMMTVSAVLLGISFS